MKPRSIQKFTKEYIELCKTMTLGERLQFVEDMRQLYAGTQEPSTKLISIKMDISLLRALKSLAKLKKIPYQTLMKAILRKELMS